MISIYDFSDYKLYLKKRLKELSTKGARSRLAEALECRPGYISQVLEGKSDLSPDQADAASLFLQHSELEARYFLLLVMRSRALTRGLKERLDRQIEEVRENQLNFKTRFKAKEVDEKFHNVIYSSWHYLALLTMLSVPKYRSLEALSARLQLPLRRVSDILGELQEAGLVERKGEKYQPGLRRTHIGKDSPLWARHHVNWRMRAIHDIEARSDRTIHFSSVASLSEKDYDAIRTKLTKMIDEVNGLIAPSPEEKVSVLCLDFFEA